jgi:phospholipase C
VAGGIEHVVILMFENRSFDHLLGHLSHGGLQPVDAARLLPSDADVSVDPGHGFRDVVRQLTGQPPPLDYAAITMDGFEANYRDRLVAKKQDPARAGEIMGCHTAEQVPALSALAEQFAVCSRWHCSVPSETWPNRLFVHGAQSEGLLHNDIRAYTHRTTFDVLRKEHLSWAVYAGDIPQAAAYFHLVDAFKDRFNPLDEFFEDAHDGTLPRYSFIEPRHFVNVSSQHPMHSVMLGDQLLRRVYTALAENQKVWESILLLVTWDEHGGFPDREKPPRAVSPFPQAGEQGFGFDVFGVRVPAIVVSPYVEAGTVDDRVYDHSSVVRTVFDTLGVDAHLTARDEAAENVLHLLTRAEPRPAPPLPAPPAQLMAAVAAEGSREPVELDDFQRGLVDLARALDEHRAGLRAAPSVAEAIAPVSEPASLERLVADFRLEHMGSRAARLHGDQPD